MVMAQMWEKQGVEAGRGFQLDKIACFVSWLFFDPNSPVFMVMPTCYAGDKQLLLTSYLTLLSRSHNRQESPNRPSYKKNTQAQAKCAGLILLKRPARKTPADRLKAARILT